MSSILKDRNKKGMTIIMSSHDLSTVESTCNKVIVMQDGYKIYDDVINNDFPLKDLYLNITKKESKGDDCDVL